MLNAKRLQNLCSMHSVAGDTLGISINLQSELNRLKVPFEVNGFGVILFGNMKSPKALITAHIDEVGFQVVKQHEDGSFAITKSGHVSPVMLNNSNVYVQTSAGVVKGVVLPKLPLGENSPTNFNQIVLDTVDNTKVKAGDFGSYDRFFSSSDKKIIAAGLDNKIGVESILELVENNKDILDNCLFAFTTEEETTYDCMRGLSLQYKPEYALVIDMLPNHQVSDDKLEVLPSAGKGASVLYSSGNYKMHPVMRNHLKKSNLQHQQVFLDLDFVPECQIIQRNGTTKAMNIFFPMLGWHNSSYSMETIDFELTMNFISDFLDHLMKV
jgi:putative aminopeptidase FrvX